MDFSWTQEQTQLRDAVAEMAQGELNEGLAERDKSGEFSRDGWRRCAEMGIHGLPIAEEFGGMGADALTTVGVLERLGYGCKDNGLVFSINAHMWTLEIPIQAFGTEEQKQRFLPGLCSGELVGGNAMSEPGSGSDAYSLATSAVRRGDRYVLNGSKLWTTGAQFADRMFCLVRTSTEGKRQEGISFVLLDMDTPGIEVEPIITLAGDHEVNQVFFDDVRVPIANRIGEENDGWTVAKYLLEFERGGSAYGPGLAAAIQRLKGMAEVEPGGDGQALIEDADFRRKLAEAEIGVGAIDATEQRLMSAMNQGQNPGAASSMMKALGTEMTQRLSELGVEAVAYYAAPFQPDARVPGSNVEPIGPDHGVPVLPRYLNFRAASIYAGSNEIQRNIMAKLVLGL